MYQKVPKMAENGQKSSQNDYKRPKILNFVKLAENIWKPPKFSVFWPKISCGKQNRDMRNQQFSQLIDFFHFIFCTGRKTRENTPLCTAATSVLVILSDHGIMDADNRYKRCCGCTRRSCTINKQHVNLACFIL